MTGAHRMQELEYVKGGATLVISVAGFDWLSKRRRRDEGLQTSDETLYWWMSIGQETDAEEERRPLACFCVPDRRRSVKSRRDTDHRSSLATCSSPCFLPKEIIHQSAFTSPDPFPADVPEEATTRLFLNLGDFSSWVLRNSNMATQQELMAARLCSNFIVCCNDVAPAPSLLGGIFSTRDCRSFFEHIRKNLPVDFKDPRWPLGPLGSEGDHSETDVRDTPSTHRGHKGLLKSCRDPEPAGSSSRGDVKMRKSVSFDDDVMVFLFDQERPTLDLQSDDSGLEWDDDFSALEEGCRSPCAGPPGRRGSPPPARRPERHCLPQRCLFLTYVTEADLEL